MQFLVITTVRESTPPEMFTPMMGALRQWAAHNTASGKIDPVFAFAGRPGGGGIFNVDSIEELDGIMAAFPFGQTSDIEIYPLTDLDGALDRAEVAFQQAMKAMEG